MLNKVKIEIYQNLEELFATATLDEMTGDIPAYKEKLETIAQVAKALGIDTKVTEASLDLETGKSKIKTLGS